MNQRIISAGRSLWRSPVQAGLTSKLDPASKLEHIAQAHGQLRWLSPRMEAARLQVSFCLSCSVCLLGSWGLCAFFYWSNFPLNKWQKALKTLCASACNKIRLFFFLGFVFPPPFLSNQITGDQSALPREEGRGGRKEGGREENCVVFTVRLSWPSLNTKPSKRKQIRLIAFSSCNMLKSDSEIN